MAEFLDLTNREFGRLKVIKVSRKVISGKRERYYWLCQCLCGKTKEIRTDSLTRGLVKSCGCLKKEQDRINLTKFHRHKMSEKRIYHIWQNMKDRCINENTPCYPRYGGRGIKVCDEWLIPDNFFSWALENGYNDNLQIDRIDNNGNYEPSNCRWVTVKENCRNRRSNIIVEYKGENMSLIELSEIVGIKYSTLRERYVKGKRGDDLIKPIQ